MKIKDLIKELKYYDEETDFAIKLVVDPHDSEKDVLVNWIGEIDTSLLDQSYIEFGVEKWLKYLLMHQWNYKYYYLEDW